MIVFYLVPEAEQPVPCDDVSEGTGHSKRTISSGNEDRTSNGAVSSLISSTSTPAENLVSSHTIYTCAYYYYYMP